ncbi:hypothetical protein A2U01_0046730, partial [Trifolium medium]|nr:hypothetical protein [Trifolium medium]
ESNRTPKLDIGMFVTLHLLSSLSLTFLSQFLGLQFHLHSHMYPFGNNTVLGFCLKELKNWFNLRSFSQ